FATANTIQITSNQLLGMSILSRPRRRASSAEGDHGMAKQRVKFTFPPNLITQPVIYNMGRQFDVVTNIRRANVTRDRGWVILEISGDTPEIERAVDWA